MAQAPYGPRAQESRNKAVVERYFREVLDQKQIELMPLLNAGRSAYCYWKSRGRGFN